MKKMKSLVDPKSLAATIDSINESFFLGAKLPKTLRVEAAEWLADRQGKPGSYAGMFAPTAADFKNGFRVFTGESISSGAGTGHILGEEACRSLLLLGVPAAGVRNALSKASVGLLERLVPCEKDGSPCGVYCCGTCSVSLWRHLLAGGLDNNERRLASGMKVLKRHRDGKGRWGRFPFYYSLLALSEIDLPSAVAEMRYAAPSLERLLKRKAKKDKYAARRRLLAERVLGIC